MAYQFKGYKVISKEQHKELLEKGYYTLSDGTQVEQDNSYLYASEETVNIDELDSRVKDNSGKIEIASEAINSLDDKKFDKTGGIISGHVSIQGNLSISGTTTNKDTETLKVKDNIVVTNSDGVELIEESGFAIKTDSTNAYGIMYDPVGDGVKIGIGSFDEDGKFAYTEGEDQFLATRADEIADGHTVIWDNENKQFIDSGVAHSEYVKVTDYATKTKAGLVSPRSKGFGIGLLGDLYLMGASQQDIAAKGSGDISITPSMLDYAVKVGVTTNTEQLTNEEKTSACDWIGAVKRCPNVSSGWRRLYGIDAYGNEQLYLVSESTQVYTIPSRGVGGTVVVGTPTANLHATPKSYVDNLPDNLELTEDSTDENGEVVKGTRTKWFEWLGAVKATNKPRNVYGTDANGKQVVIPCTNNMQGSGVVQRNPDGSIQTPKATGQVHAVNNERMIDYVGNLPDNLTLTDDTTAEDGTVTEGTKTKWQKWLGLDAINTAIEAILGV